MAEEKKILTPEEVVNEINKKYKTIKITTMSKAKSFVLKRFFTGSFNIDYLTGGGYGFRRIIMLFGARSAGKNGSLNQTIAFNQRICRHCGGVALPYYESATPDKWTYILKEVMGVSPCTCKDNQTEGRIFWFLDYEKSLSVEDAKPTIVLDITNTTTKEKIDEETYIELLNEYAALVSKDTLTDEEKTRLDNIEKFRSNLDVKENVINKMRQTDYLISCGVNIDKLLVSDPETTDEGIDMIQKMIPSKGCDGIIWDSIQAAIPKYVEERSAEQATMGQEAKMNGLLMRKVCSGFAAANLEDESEAFKPALFVTSQVRSDIGSFSAGPDSFSGGNALAHHISAALEFKREKFLTEAGTEAKFEDTFYGQRVRVRAEKNKLNSPGDMLTYNYYFKQGSQCTIGIDYVSELYLLGTKLGIINQRGSVYDLGGQTFKGKDTVLEMLRMDSGIASTVYKGIQSRL